MNWAFLINLATALINASTLTVLIILYLLGYGSPSQTLVVSGTLLFVLVAIVLTAVVEALSIVGIILDARTEEIRRGK